MDSDRGNENVTVRYTQSPMRFLFVHNFPSVFQILKYINSELGAQASDAEEISKVCTLLSIPLSQCPINVVSHLNFAR